MSEFDYQKQAQEYHGKVPLIILGSGASAAYGMSGMGALANHLIENVDVSNFNPADSSAWVNFCKALNDGVDLETALQKVTVSDTVTDKIISSTWVLINNEDIKIFRESLQHNGFFILTNLLEHIFKSSVKTINIITTNYDRLAEYACEQGRFHHHTGFTHGYFRQLASPTELSLARKVNIWKVHGSLDWFQSPLSDTVALSNVFEVPDRYKPEIVTPGTQKYHRTHLEPFRSIIQYADLAISNAGSYLCIGYGFNDEHIQPKLMVKCLRNNTPITIITYALSDAAKKIVTEGKAKNFLAIERGKTDEESVIYSSLSKEPIIVDKNIWSLEGYLTLIL